MKIRVPITTYTEIDLDEEKQAQVTSAYIRKKCNIPDVAFIENDVLHSIEEHYTSHSWEEDVSIREATELDRAALLILKHIRK